MRDWLELELAHQLAPVRAPGDLWERVEKAADPAAHKPHGGAHVWRIAAIIVLMIAAGTLWYVARGAELQPLPRHLAAEQVRSRWIRQTAAERPSQACLACHNNL